MLKNLAKWLTIFSLLALFVYTFIHPLLIPIDHLKKEFPKEPSMMKYRREQFEREGKPFILRYYPVPLSKISPYLVKAVLIAEVISSIVMRGLIGMPFKRLWKKT
jgi:monofunctional biosynthetic peptidoglycan transglycosylase